MQNKTYMRYTLCKLHNYIQKTVTWNSHEWFTWFNSPAKLRHW